MDDEVVEAGDGTGMDVDGDEVVEVEEVEEERQWEREVVSSLEGLSGVEIIEGYVAILSFRSSRLLSD
jgi:hypothetical protein